MVIALLLQSGLCFSWTTSLALKCMCYRFSRSCSMHENPLWSLDQTWKVPQISLSSRFTSLPVGGLTLHMAKLYHFLPIFTISLLKIWRLIPNRWNSLLQHSKTFGSEIQILYQGCSWSNSLLGLSWFSASAEWKTLVDGLFFFLLQEWICNLIASKCKALKWSNLRNFSIKDLVM